ncbi:hypothetical protein [Slackia sp.]|uniref:hypothetical protein n=1 Tax=Slackia sp. TaxID=2049041 RepID=UPI0026239964|nr:hypothetical protein [Slackia sp.]
MGKPPETTHFSHEWRRVATWGFANGAQTTRADSFAVVASGLRVMLRLSFRNGRFRPIGHPNHGRKLLWDRNKKLKALSLKKVFEVVPNFVPEADETRHRVIRRHAFRVDAENWVQLE